MTPFIHYITGWYCDKDTARQKELRDALLSRCQTFEMASHMLFSEDRGSYARLIAFGIKHCNIVNVLINADCWIDHEDAGKLKVIRPDEVWCISRIDAKEAKDSQDAWAWRGKLDIPDANYPLGLPGCDNRFACQCAEAGRKLLNPCRSIRVHHNHESKVRHYTEDDRVKGKTEFVEPCSIDERLTCDTTR